MPDLELHKLPSSYSPASVAIEPMCNYSPAAVFETAILRVLCIPWQARLSS